MPEFVITGRIHSTNESAVRGLLLPELREMGMTDIDVKRYQEPSNKEDVPVITGLSERDQKIEAERRKFPACKCTSLETVNPKCPVHG